MPVQEYGVLKGCFTRQTFADATRDDNHYRLKVDVSGVPWEVSVNVQSTGPGGKDLQYAAIVPFIHRITPRLEPLPQGWTSLPPQPEGAALDFRRYELVRESELQLLAMDVAGAHNDLREKIDDFVADALAQDHFVYVFGSRIAHKNMVHEIHMNQGNGEGRFKPENGPWQDGGLLVALRQTGDWRAIFLKFQSQTWFTDAAGNQADAGHTDTPAPRREPPAPTPVGQPVPLPRDIAALQVSTLLGSIRIAAALVNPVGPAPEAESVTLLNLLDQAVSLDGWQLRDKQGNAFAPGGNLAPGEGRVIAVQAPTQLSNRGGSITLLDVGGRLVDHVVYPASQAAHEGSTITF